VGDSLSESLPFYQDSGQYLKIAERTTSPANLINVGQSKHPALSGGPASETATVCDSTPLTDKAVSPPDGFRRESSHRHRRPRSHDRFIVSASVAPTSRGQCHGSPCPPGELTALT
jgi:hypothetical protein